MRLFDEKYRDCTTPALRAESRYSFYDRSSLDEAARVREMLQRWLDRLPPSKQKDIVGRMRHKGRGSQERDQSFDGAFFELFLHEFLNGTGGETVVEPKADHLTPDFGVTETGPEGTQIHYVVEATDINVERGTNLETDWNEKCAIDILDEIETPDYFLSVTTAGKLDTMPRKRDLKRPFEELVKTADYDDVREKAEMYGLLDGTMPSATFQHGGWRVTGSLVPVGRHYRPKQGGFIGVDATGDGAHIDDIGKPKERLYDKAKRYKDVDNLIIALRVDPNLGRLDQTLFGTLAYQVYFHKDPAATGPVPEPHHVQKRDGFWFNSSGPQNQNVIGVVAFHNLYPHCVDRATAVFYTNPYAEQPLPAWASEITHADYGDGTVKIVKGQNPCAFVSDYEPFNDFHFSFQ